MNPEQMDALVKFLERLRDLAAERKVAYRQLTGGNCAATRTMEEIEDEVFRLIESELNQ